MTEETGVIMVTMNYVPGKKITKVIGTVWGITISFCVVHNMFLYAGQMFFSMRIEFSCRILIPLCNDNRLNLLRGVSTDKTRLFQHYRIQVSRCRFFKLIITGKTT